MLHSFHNFSSLKNENIKQNTLNLFIYFYFEFTISYIYSTQGISCRFSCSPGLQYVIDFNWMKANVLLFTCIYTKNYLGIMYSNFFYTMFMMMNKSVVKEKKNNPKLAVIEKTKLCKVTGVFNSYSLSDTFD